LPRETILPLALHSNLLGLAQGSQDGALLGSKRGDNRRA